MKYNYQVLAEKVEISLRHYEDILEDLRELELLREQSKKNGLYIVRDIFKDYNDEEKVTKISIQNNNILTELENTYNEKLNEERKWYKESIERYKIVKKDIITDVCSYIENLTGLEGWFGRKISKKIKNYFK